MNNIVTKIQDSPWLLAVMIIIANIGFSQLEDELDKKTLDFFNGPISRRIILFALLFCGTKDLKVSFLATLAYMIFVYFF